MNPALSILFLVLLFVLALVSLVQLLYTETLRLLAKETRTLAYFQEHLQESFGKEPERGAQIFALWKHGVMLWLGAISLGMVLTRTHEDVHSLSAGSLIEAVLVSWVSVAIFAYLVPQILYRRTSGHWLIAVNPLIRLMLLVMAPLTVVFHFLHSLFELGREAETAEETGKAEAEQVEKFIDAGTDEGIIEEEDKRLIQSVVAFGDKRVREVMTPRPNVVAIEANQSLDELHKLVVVEQYSRIPVYEEVLDQMVGFVHVRDLFELSEESRRHKKVHDIKRPIRQVPETKLVGQLLREMQEDGQHIAAVIDEYGNMAGLATMEDLVEEILGEIRDEHEPAKDVEEDGPGRWIVAGSFDVDGLADLIGFRPSGEIESTTLGGLAAEWLGRVPKAGEEVEKEGLRIEVLSASDRRVEQVRVSEAAAKEIASPAESAEKEKA